MNSLLFSCMHTHTNFCDGKDDIETMCAAAYKKKLHSIGFSAHAPILKKTGIKTDWNMPDDRFDEYVEQVLAAKHRWHGKLDVFLGFEVDYIKGLRSAIDSDIKAVNPDFLISSAHFVIPANGARPFTVDGPEEELLTGIKEGFNGDAQALMHYYYDAMTEMIALGGFEILGHADIIKKNCINKKYWPQENEVCRQKEIACIAAKAGITVEVNTGGINNGKINEVYPSPVFLSFFREHHVPVIITADAHRAEHIDGNYDIAIQTLLCANFKEYGIFLGKIEGKPQWKKIKIN